MNILRLQPSGVDVVTFWTSEEKPEGAFLAFDHPQAVYGVAALQLNHGDPFNVGLLEVPTGLYKLVAQINDDKSITDHDMAFISDPQQVMCVAQPGGVGIRSPEVVKAMQELQQRLYEPGIGAVVQAAIREAYGFSP